jgi:hypothetical protein
MKTWLRLTLITVTVGGGFTGLAATVQSLCNSQSQPPLNLLLIAVFLALYAYVTVSGLMFVHDPQGTRPLIAALAIQIPWISSPLIVYKFAAGFHAALAVGGGLDAEARLGCFFKFSLFEENPWRIGVNLFALAILILLCRSVRTPTSIVSSTASAPAGPTSTACNS